MDSNEHCHGSRYSLPAHFPSFLTSFPAIKESSAETKGYILKYISIRSNSTFYENNMA